MVRLPERTISRVLAVLLLLAISAMGPWWIAGIVLAFFSYRFPKFYEGVLAGLFIDLLYAPPEASLLLKAKFTLASVALIYLTSNLRRYLRVGASHLA